MPTPDERREKAETDMLAVVPAEHIYLSTGCHPAHEHERLSNGQTGHEYCESMTGLNGAKRPAECKHCASPCQCPNHVVAS